MKSNFPVWGQKIRIIAFKDATKSARLSGLHNPYSKALWDLQKTPYLNLSYLVQPRST